jgi:hypothetical protein
MSELPKKTNTTSGAIEKAVIRNDLQSLTEIERIQYNFAACRSLGLNPLTRPFDYIIQDGKMSLYLNTVGVAQLRAIYGISVKVKDRSKDDEFIYCTAIAWDNSGRSEEATAVLSLCDKYNKPLIGQAKANLIMKCETKAKRRATLALRGIPWGDSGEIKSNLGDPPLDILPTEFDPDF